MAMLASVQMRKEKKTNNPGYFIQPATSAITSPLVSVIIPAYNEEVNSVRTIRSILNQDYPNLEIIFVNDGSKDKTLEKITDAFKDFASVKILQKRMGARLLP